MVRLELLRGFPPRFILLQLAFHNSLGSSQRPVGGGRRRVRRNREKQRQEDYRNGNPLRHTRTLRLSLPPHSKVLQFYRGP